MSTNDTNTNRGVIDFFQGELIFLFIISISLHNLRPVSGFFLLNNDDSFNVFGHHLYVTFKHFFFHNLNSMYTHNLDN
jgi:hypothetical protein